MFFGTPEERAKRGTVLFYHGFGSTKETYRAELAKLAEAGFLAIGIDGIGHGERRYPDFNERFPPLIPSLAGDPQLEAAFLTIVRLTAQEIPSILDTLVEYGWAHAGCIGIAGQSFGGFVTYAAIIADRRIQVATPIAGSPQWKLLWPGSPHLHSDQFFPVALLSQTGGQDTNVLPEIVHTFHQQLAWSYQRAPERLNFIEYPGASHDLSADEWTQAWSAAVRWFETFLPA